MKEITQRKIFSILKKKGIKKFVGVPDSTTKHFIDEGLKKEKILITTREEEGPICILVKIEKSSVRSIRVDITPPNIKTRFMKSLK